jgi:serine protease Do
LRTTLAAILLLAALPPAAAQSQDLAVAHRAADRAADAVVLVEYVLEKAGRGFGGVGQRAEAAAVGTIATADGLVLVPSSIFPEEEDEQREPARPSDFHVRLRDGRRLPAQLLGRDRTRAVAFLRLEAPGPGRQRFPFVDFVDARPAAGDPVVLVELLPEKYDFAPSMRHAAIGAIVAKPRPLYDLDAFLQESGIGTPVIDARGRAIGLVSTDPLGESGGALAAPLRLIGSLSRQKAPGFPMVVPSSELRPLITSPPEAETATKTKERAWLGVTLQAVSRPLAEYLRVPWPTGPMITSVWPESPAQKAGLRNEDIIVEFAGEPARTPSDDALPAFIDHVQDSGPGKTVAIGLLREAKRMDADVTLGVAPTTSVAAQEYRSETFGLLAQNLTLDIAMSRGWPEDLAGALVSEVETAGWAQVGGLERGDLIQAVGGEPVANVEDLEAALRKAEAGKPAEVVFFVLRDPDTLFIPVKTAW